MLDVRTVVLIYTLTNCVCMLVIIFLWKQNRRRFAGLGFWVLDYIMQFASLLLISSRGFAPDYISVLLGTPLAVTGSLLIFIGLEGFTHKRGPQIQNYILLALYFTFHGYFTYHAPGLMARNILFSVVLSIICFQCSALLIFRVDKETLRRTKAVGLVFAVICIVSIIRIIFDIAVNPGNDFLQSNIYDIAVLIIYQMMFIILTFSLLLMVNRTLFDDLEKDINRCEEAEAELRNSEEKFSRTFHASPDAILISRMEDGRIIDVNEGFSRLSGYTHEEALSSTSLSLWTDPADREVLVNSLRKKQVLSNVKMNFRARSGATLSCLYSGVFIKLGGEDYILSVVRDFTEHEQSEKILRIRLEIWEYAYNHSIKEIMVKSLDEIEKLTGSLIGFYHFVNEKEKTLILQVWSTRTRHEYCRAEGEDMHYPLDSAGVWADCVRERRAVIHNDYSSLPNRRGMPAGHASLTRELVVPIMRDNQIVSVLGVGNKPDAYNEKDVVLVSFIADLLWTIVSHKRAEEEIRSLNDQLEKMAMTDHLTGIANNRSFYLQGTEEIKRAVRYRHPLTLVMLDIDKFKVINDTYGHKAGDKILQNIAEILKKSIRNVDFIGRLSGEEFGILMPNTAASDAAVFAERLRAAVEAAECMIGDAIIKVTASFGISNWNDSSGSADIEKLLRQADEAMYEAKRQGRNRIIYHDKERKDHDIHI